MKFSSFIENKESSNGSSYITGKIKLQKDSTKEFAPFVVDLNSHSNLRPLIKAFINSPQIGVGYTTIEKSKGELEPKLKKKNIYLTGGTVRDHLKNKSFDNYNLVTDATISEIKMILSKSEEGFKEIRCLSCLQSNFANSAKYSHLPSNGGNKVFYVSKWDKEGKEIEITVVVNGDNFFISPFSNHSKSKNVVPDKASFASSIEDDAKNRDLTVNSLYIPLNNPDGENNDLIDPYGGANDLKNNKIKFLDGESNNRLKEDPLTSLKFLNFNSRYGNPQSLKAQENSLKNNIEGLKSDSELKKQFFRGLEHPDVNAREYMLDANNLGILSKVYPDLNVEVDTFPNMFQGDRLLSSAWVLRNNDPNQIKSSLCANGWTPNECNDICYLVRLYNWSNRDFDHNNFYDIKNMHNNVLKSKVKTWGDFLNRPEEFDKFINYDHSDLQPFTNSGENGEKMLNPLYFNVLNRAPAEAEMDYIKRNLYANKWKSMIN